MPVIIDQEKCKGISECPGEGLCIKLCEKGALEEKDNQIVFISEKCDDCDICIPNCPSQANGAMMHQ
jgi:Fe-S-cluster-containing hydrogenase component 2